LFGIRPRMSRIHFTSALKGEGGLSLALTDLKWATNLAMDCRKGWMRGNI